MASVCLRLCFGKCPPMQSLRSQNKSPGFSGSGPLFGRFWFHTDMIEINWRSNQPNARHRLFAACSHTAITHYRYSVFGAINEWITNPKINRRNLPLYSEFDDRDPAGRKHVTTELSHLLVTKTQNGTCQFMLRASQEAPRLVSWNFAQKKK